jgi:hypothetical protein
MEVLSSSRGSVLAASASAPRRRGVHPSVPARALINGNSDCRFFRSLNHVNSKGRYFCSPHSARRSDLIEPYQILLLKLIRYIGKQIVIS